MKTTGKYILDDKGRPVLWETMVFTGKGKKRKGGEMDRCSGSRQKAEAMHARMVARMEKLKL